MADEAKKAVEVSNTLVGRSIFPFTSGIFAIYAFFWPEGFGHWFGSIVRAFRDMNGW